MSKPGFVYETGNDPYAYDSPSAFSRYARRELGVEVPIYSGRAVWYTKLKKEMEEMGWTWDDLEKTVRYIKAHRKNCETIFGVLYYVQEAQNWVEELDRYDLQAKVADAISQEEDESWRRKLSIAQGQALRKVYEMWQKERQHAV